MTTISFLATDNPMATRNNRLEVILLRRDR
jgi:hypothetical protein